MNSIKIIVSIAVVLLLGGVALFTFTDKDDMKMMKGDAMMEKENMQDDAMTQDGVMENGSYQVYSEEKVVLANEGDVVLFFKAPWCPTCRALDADIKANMSSIPGDLTILEVDYDSSTELKQKYGVTLQHTMVQVDASGNMITKWTGSPTLAALTAKVE